MSRSLGKQRKFWKLELGTKEKQAMIGENKRQKEVGLSSTIRGKSSLFKMGRNNKLHFYYECKFA